MMASGMLLPPSAQQQNDGSGSTYNKYMVPIRLADRDRIVHTTCKVLNRTNEAAHDDMYQVCC